MSGILYDIGKGIIAAFVATLVLSGLLLLKNAVGFLPGLDLVGATASAVGTSGSAVLEWTLHFAVATILFGILFAALDSHMPRPEGIEEIFRGAFFGVVVWVVVMLLFMPATPAGFFALELGGAAPVTALALYIIYGAVLGAVYSWLRPEVVIE